MLADICGNDCLSLGKVTEHIEDMLGPQASTLGVLEREFFLPAGDGLEPGPGVEAVDMLDELLENELCIADEGNIGLDDLAMLCRVDVEVDLLCIGAELAQLTGDPVIPPCLLYTSPSPRD